MPCLVASWSSIPIYFNLFPSFNSTIFSDARRSSNSVPEANVALSSEFVHRNLNSCFENVREKLVQLMNFYVHDRILDRKVLEAVEAGDQEALATAFAAGASPNARTHASVDSLSGVGISPSTALSLAAYHGDITMVNKCARVIL